jgi:hypothetical protein
MPYLSTNELDAIALCLQHYSDTSDFWQIKINGKVASFRGVRLFANEGVAKSALNKELQYIINQLEYRSSYPPKDSSRESIINAYDLIKAFVARNATTTSNGKPNGKKYFTDDEVKVLAPKLRDELLKSGHFKIEKV